MPTIVLKKESEHKTKKIREPTFLIQKIDSSLGKKKKLQQKSFVSTKNNIRRNFLGRLEKMSKEKSPKFQFSDGDQNKIGKVAV